MVCTVAKYAVSDASSGGRYAQGFTKSIAALALLADKLKSHGQILTKIKYILSSLCMENVGKRYLTQTKGVLDSIFNS